MEPTSKKELIPLKLNYKRTICVGFAFFLICAFWQAYDNTIPLILTNKFGMKQTWSGFIMALDNILALFLLPLFGSLSDRSKSRFGRRTPFIVAGTLIAVVAFVGLSFVDAAQLKHLSEVSAIDDPVAMQTIYSAEQDRTLLTPEGESFVLSERYTAEEFSAIQSQITEGESTITNPDYTNYVVPARQAYAWQMTAESPSTLIFFTVSGRSTDAGCYYQAASLQGKRRHKPHGKRRWNSGSDPWHGLCHQCRPKFPDELCRIFLHHRTDHDRCPGDLPPYCPGTEVCC